MGRETGEETGGLVMLERWDGPLLKDRIEFLAGRVSVDGLGGVLIQDSSQHVGYKVYLHEGVAKRIKQGLARLQGKKTAV